MFNPEKIFSENKIEKPKFLYHASVDKNIEKLIPQRKNVRDDNEGQVIFSTPDYALASIFLINGHNDNWIRLGKFNGISYVLISDKERFLNSDNGGAIYTLSSEKFSFDPNKGMCEDEWTSKEHVEPIAKDEFSSSLDAMLKSSVQVYFCNQEEFEKYNLLSKERRYDEIANFLIGLGSENEKVGINVNKYFEKLK